MFYMDFSLSTFCPLEHSPPAASLYWDPLSKDVKRKQYTIYSLPTCTIHQITSCDAGPKDDLEITNQLQLSKWPTYRSRVSGGMQMS